MTRPEPSFASLRAGWCAAVVAAAACADPAALEVIVDVNAQQLDALNLVVRKGGPDGDAFIDCRVPFQGSVESACGFEGGSGRWLDPNRVSFVLFGEPDVPLDIEIEGDRDGRVVTTTRAASRLPPRAAERATLRLALFGRTAVRLRCAVQIEPPPGEIEPSLDSESQTALTLANLTGSPGLEVLLSVDGELVVVEYVPQGGACDLRPRTLRDPAEDRNAPYDPDRWCRVLPGSLVVGSLDSQTRVAASLCSQAPPGRARLKVAVLSAEGIDIRTVTINAPLSRVSMPTVVDFDGDGAVEVVMLVQSSGAFPAEVQVARYDPVTDQTTAQGIGAYDTLARGRTALPPIVFAGDGGDALFVVGYPGPIGVYDGMRFAQLAGNGVRGTRAPLVVDGTDAVVVQEVRGPLVVASRLVPTFDRQGWRPVATATAALPEVPADELVRLSAGLTKDGTAVTAFVHDGFVYGWLLAAEPAPLLVETLGPEIGSQPLLHVNLDGQPGTELVSYAEDSNVIRAVDQQGQVLTGWPLMLSGDSGVRRVIVSDLEVAPPRDDRVLRTAEVIGLTYRQLEILSLGAGSYDQSQWPWPSTEGGARGRMSSTGDPFRR